VFRWDPAPAPCLRAAAVDSGRLPLRVSYMGTPAGPLQDRADWCRRRIAEGDVEGLCDLLDLGKDLDAATQVAVDGLRAWAYSRSEIASRLGTSRQNAQQRWGR
jgi:hypothetical protein